MNMDMDIMMDMSHASTHRVRLDKVGVLDVATAVVVGRRLPESEQYLSSDAAADVQVGAIPGRRC